ncbi:hypothetical protein DAMDJJ_23935 [Cupriavidus necator]
MASRRSETLISPPRPFPRSLRLFFSAPAALRFRPARHPCASAHAPGPGFRFFAVASSRSFAIFAMGGVLAFACSQAARHCRICSGCMPFLRQYSDSSASLSGAVSSTTRNLSALDHLSLCLPLPGTTRPCSRASLVGTPTAALRAGPGWFAGLGDMAIAIEDQPGMSELAGCTSWGLLPSPPLPQAGEGRKQRARDRACGLIGDSPKRAQRCVPCQSPGPAMLPARSAAVNLSLSQGAERLRITTTGLPATKGQPGRQSGFHSAVGHSDA